MIQKLYHLGEPVPVDPSLASRLAFLVVVAFAALGFSFVQWWPLLLGMIAAVVAGSWVGTRLRDRIPQLDFQRWFRWLVTLLALRMIAYVAMGGQ